MSDKIHVLAVDDAAANLMILRGCLKGDAFELTTSTNALDALEKFKESFFDVVLLDLIMPGIDGFELRKLIREIDRERPIIFLTSMMEDGSLKMLNQIAWDANTYYLNKSTDRKTLIQKITEVVDMRRTRQIERMHSRKLESELKLAGELQNILLPNWCVCDENMLISSLYKPASYVSGDIFEMIRLSGDKYLLFIGDIAGHGVSAALYMATIQAWLKVTIHEQEPTPHELLTKLNTFFCEELHCSTYMTALAAVIDFKNNHICLHSAGHPPLIFGSPSKSTFHCGDQQKGDMPLGWFPNAEYPESANYDYDFADDTIFIGSTDGVLDIRNENGGTLNHEDYTEIVGELLHDTDCMVFPYRLRDVIEKIGYTMPDDDVTFIALTKRRFRKRFIERLIPPKLAMVEKVATVFSGITDDAKRGAEIDLLVHEYLNNIIVHGNESPDKKSDMIYISITATDDEIVVRGVKRGESCNPTLADSGSETELRPGYIPTSGRGLQILRSITDFISYNSYSGLNETCFVLKNKTMPKGGDN